jgi:hypothetical protein
MVLNRVTRFAFRLWRSICNNAIFALVFPSEEQLFFDCLFDLNFDLLILGIFEFDRRNEILFERILEIESHTSKLDYQTISSRSAINLAHVYLADQIAQNEPSRSERISRLRVVVHKRKNIVLPLLLKLLFKSRDFKVFLFDFLFELAKFTTAVFIVRLVFLFTF